MNIFLPVLYGFVFVFSISVYSLSAASVAYIFVVHNCFWLPCHIYLGCSSQLFCICSSHRGGRLERMGEVPYCNIGTLRIASFSYSFVCLTNHVGQNQAADQTCLSTPLGCSPIFMHGHMLIVTLCSLSNDIIFLIWHARCALSFYDQNSNSLRKINLCTPK